MSESLAQIQRTLDFTQDFTPARSKAAFTLALSDHSAFVLLPELVRRVHVESPDVILNVRGFTNRRRAHVRLDLDLEAPAGRVSSATPSRAVNTRPPFPRGG